MPESVWILSYDEYEENGGGDRGWFTSEDQALSHLRERCSGSDHIWSEPKREDDGSLSISIIYAPRRNYTPSLHYTIRRQDIA
jgi:hypothetical protein